MATSDGNTVATLVWDFQQPEQKVSNRPFYSRVVPSSPSAPVAMRVSHVKPGKYRLQVRRSGFRANDAYSAYIEMGAPKTLTPAQVDQLHALTKDAPETDRVVRIGKDGAFTLTVPMRSNDIALVTLTRAD